MTIVGKNALKPDLGISVLFGRFLDSQSQIVTYAVENSNRVLKIILKAGYRKRIHGFIMHTV
jgi:hypothetical protein